MFSAPRLFLLLFLFSFSSLFAQVGTLNMIPAQQSPTASGLGKFVEVPVGNYNGLPNISIPIYEIKANGLTIPISIGYHALGLKPRDIPGQVGAGWSLNAGGMITRVVRQYPDDHDPYLPVDFDDYYDSIFKAKSASATLGNFNTLFTPAERLEIIFATPGITSQNESDMNWSYGRRDMERDLYYFNFLGYSGKFTFDNFGKPMLLGNTDLRIEYANRKFIITDAGGIQYEFFVIEQAMDRGSNHKPFGNTQIGYGRHYTTSWYLSKVRIPHKEFEIGFSYRTFSNSQIYPENIRGLYPGAFDSRTIKIRYYLEQFPDFSWTPAYQCEPFVTEWADTAPDEYGTNILLDEISWLGHKVKFFGETNRSDMYKYKLDSIKVISGTEVLNHTKFSYSYFNDGAGFRIGKKLKLDSLRINDQQFRFSYYDSLYGKGVPALNNKGTDIWGYYNGEDDDQIKTPNFKVFYYAGIYPQVFSYVGNVSSTARNPDAKFAQLGTIKSITYPTGGKTLFEFEGNDYSYYPFIQTAHTIESDPLTQLIFDSVNYKRCEVIGDPYGITRNSEFVIHKGQAAKVLMTMGQWPFQSYQHYIDSGWYHPWTYNLVYLQRYNETSRAWDNVYSKMLFPRDTIGQPIDQNQYEQKKYRAWINDSVSVTVSEGLYRIQATASGWHTSTIVTVKSVFPYLKKQGVYNAGGLRIKRISFEDKVSAAPTLVQTFTYENSNLSSGSLESPFANFGSAAWISAPVPYEHLNLQTSCSFYTVSADPVIPLGNAHGGVIGYKKVTVTRDDNSKSVYHYTSGEDNRWSMADKFVNSQVLNTVTRMREDNSWKRGLLKQAEFFNASGEPVRREYHDFRFDTSSMRNRLVTAYMDEIILRPSGSLNFFYAGEPRIYSGGTYQTFTIKDSVVDYSPSGVLSTVTNYQYHPNAWPHGFPVSISKNGSTGERLIERNSYPGDYNNVGLNPTNPVAKSIKNLISRNMISGPIEKLIQKSAGDGTALRTLSGEYLRFKETGPFPDTSFKLNLFEAKTGYLPVVIDSTVTVRDPKYAPGVIYNLYDSFGNLVEYSSFNNVKEVLLWGYQHQYIVARVTGSNYATVAALVDQNILNSPASEQQLNNELNKIRTALAATAAQVRSFTYLPLVGISSETDIKGRKTFYSYDKAGRLILVRDHNNNVLKKIRYNYAGEPESDE